MKGSSHPSNDVSLTTSTKVSIRDVIDRVPMDRRSFVRTGLIDAALASAGGPSLAGLVQTVDAAPIAPGPAFPGIGFESIPASRDIDPGTASAVLDRVSVPAGDSDELLVAWGDAITPGGTPFSGQADETAAEQARQFGMHCDGMHDFACGPSTLGRGGDQEERRRCHRGG